MARRNWKRFRKGKGVYWWCSKGHFYKAYSSACIHLAEASLKGAGIAKRRPFSVFGSLNPKVVYRGRLGELHRYERLEKPRDMGKFSRAEREDIVATLIRAVPESCVQLDWDEFEPEENVWSFLRFLPVSTRNNVRDSLRSFVMPRTGSHRDFGHSNVVRDASRKLWVIDWDSSRESGTVYFDAFRAFLMMNKPKDVATKRVDKRQLRLISLRALLSTNMPVLEKILRVPKEVLVSWYVVQAGASCYHREMPIELREERLHSLATFLNEFQSSNIAAHARAGRG